MDWNSVQSWWPGWGGEWLTEMYSIRGRGVQFRLSFFLSIVRHASTQRRTPAPRGMATQHLRTFERGVAQNKRRYLKGVYYLYYRKRNPIWNVVQARSSFFHSIVRHASTQRRTPAPRGMVIQHLRTFERVPAVYSLFAGTVPAAYSLFAGTVPAFNL